MVKLFYLHEYPRETKKRLRPSDIRRRGNDEVHNIVWYWYFSEFSSVRPTVKDR